MIIAYYSFLCFFFEVFSVLLVSICELKNGLFPKKETFILRQTYVVF